MDKKVLKRIEDIAKKIKIKLVILFGSRARGDDKGDSDYDIGVYGQRCLNEDEMIAIQHAFEKVLHTDRLDIVDLKKAKPLLKIKAFEQFKVLYESDPFLKFQIPLSAQSEFEECRDLYEMRRQRLEEFVNET